MAYEDKQGNGSDSGSDEDFIKEARDGLKSCVEDESDERSKMMDDLKFCTLDQ